MYRALLRECTRLPLVTEHDTAHGARETLQSLVRYRFERDRQLQSPTQIVNGIETGHGLLHQLRLCSSKSSEALGRLGQMLESMTVQAETTMALRAQFASHWKPPPPQRLKYLQNIHLIRNKANYLPQGPRPRIFEHPRPLSEVKTGVRKVPNLIVTQGVPLLKYPGPQPVLLNRVLKSKTLWGVKMFQKHEKLVEGAHLAECEDEWDMILQRQHGIRDADASEEDSSVGLGPLRRAGGAGSWAKTFVDVDKDLEQQVMARGRKYATLGKRLWEVVLAEREMKEKERKEAKRLRRRESKGTTSAQVAAASVDGS